MKGFRTFVPPMFASDAPSIEQINHHIRTQATLDEVQRYQQMRPAERAKLKRENPEFYAVLRTQSADVEARPWAYGVAYPDLRPAQRAAWQREDPVAARAARDAWKSAGGGLR